MSETTARLGFHIAWSNGGGAVCLALSCNFGVFFVVGKPNLKNCRIFYRCTAEYRSSVCFLFGDQVKNSLSAAHLWRLFCLFFCGWKTKLRKTAKSFSGLWLAGKQKLFLRRVRICGIPLRNDVRKLMESLLCFLGLENRT